MSATSQPPEVLIAQAAAMRAAGESWDAVAKRVGRSCGRIRHWPSNYPAEWNRAYRTAVSQQVAEGADEATRVLRKLMRSEDPKIAMNAAREMWKVCLNIWKLDLEQDKHRAAKRPAAPASPSPTQTSAESKPAPSNVEIPDDDSVELTPEQDKLLWEVWESASDEDKKHWFEEEIKELDERIAATAAAVLPANAIPIGPSFEMKSG